MVCFLSTVGWRPYKHWVNYALQWHCSVSFASQQLFNQSGYTKRDWRFCWMIPGNYSYQGCYRWFLPPPLQQHVLSRDITSLDRNMQLGQKKQVSYTAHKPRVPQTSPNQLSARTPAKLQDEQAHIERYLTTIKKNPKNQNILIDLSWRPE